LSTVLDEWRATACVELNSALDNEDNDAATADSNNAFIYENTKLEPYSVNTEKQAAKVTKDALLSE